MLSACRDPKILAAARAINVHPDALECVRLREQVADLKLEVEYWRDMVCGSAEDAAILAKEFGLKPAESAFLAALYRGAGRVLDKEALMHAVPARDVANDERNQKMVDVYICHLRNKLGSDAIVTFWGRGHMLAQTWVERIQVLLAR